MAGKNTLIYSLFFMFIVILFMIVLKGLAITQPGDENVYYYMGKLVSEGKIPYKDFFYAHPPLQIYLISAVYRMFGFNIMALKLIPLISMLITSFFIFKISKEKFGNAEAIISVMLFLFSYSVMFNSVFDFGINLAVMFLVIGVYFLINKNNRYVAGIFFALASLTRLLALIPILTILIFLCFNKKYSGLLKLSSTFFILFLLFNGALILIFGNDYLNPVYTYHLSKSLGGTENLREYLDIIKLNWILFASAVIIVFASNRKQINLFAIVSIVYLIFLLTLKKLFGFYFIIVFPFMAITGGYSLGNIYRNLKINKRFKVIILIILIAIFLWNLASDAVFLEKIGFAGFERGKDLVDFVNANSVRNTMLFGDESIVPLLALSTGKKIALDFVDTNNQIFISGMRNLNNVLMELKGKDILFVIRSQQGISYFAEVRRFLNDNCELLSTFHDNIEGDYLVYRCKNS